jgi:hypothetical protein
LVFQLLSEEGFARGDGGERKDEEILPKMSDVSFDVSHSLSEVWHISHIFFVIK